MIFLLLFPAIFWDCLAVKPVWKTPVSEPNPTANVEVLKERSNLAKRAQPNYYTRPEQVSIPDYRPPPQKPPHQQTSGGHFRPFAWVGPQPKAGSPQTSYYEQAPNKGQFPRGLPPLPPNWRQYPVQMIWIPDSPGQPPPSVGPMGPPLVSPSYGVYGPSTEEPMKPSAYPESYTGTVAHSPAVSPVETTLPYEPPSPYGGGQTAMSSSTRSSTIVPSSSSVPRTTSGSIQNTAGSTRTSEVSTRTSSSAVPSSSLRTTVSTTSSTAFSTASNSRTVSSTVPDTSSSKTATTKVPSGASTMNPTIRPGPQEPSGGGSNSKITLPFDADDTTTISSSTTLFQMTTNPFDHTSAKTVPPVFLGSDEEDEDENDTEDISQTTERPELESSEKPTPQEEEEEMMKNFFPRPVTSQAYQPPGHQPEDFTSHINVNFKKPKTGHGVDTDKISLYKPDHEGTGPTLVISNAAKDDASRAGYKPAPPPVLNPYIPPPPPPHPKEEYATPYTVPPGSRPFPTFSTPPRSLVPVSSLQTTSTTPAPEQEFHETTIDTIPPTAQTIPTRYTPSLTTTTPAPPPPTTTEKDFPEYVPPAIAHMTPSTPSGKNPPTFVPFDTTTTSITSPPPSEETLTTTPATVTRQPEFPSKTMTPPLGGNVPGVETTVDYVTPSTESYSESVTEQYTTSVFMTTSEVDETSQETSTDSFTTSEPTGTSTVTSTDRFTPSEGSTPSESTFTDRFTPSDVETTSEVPQTSEPTTRTFTDRFSPSEFITSTTSTTSTTTTTTQASPPGIQPKSPPRGNPYAPPEGAPRVPNRLIGKPRILCLEDGISFQVKTILPLNGEAFANDRKRVPECQKTFTEDANPKLFLPFETCGVKNVGDQVDSRTQYHMQVVLIIDNGNGTNTLQSFMAQCVHQKVNYNKQVLPKRIEEALEELRLVPSKLEQKASMPNVQMQIVVDEGHHKLGAEVSAADIGMPLALKWTMVPESDAYGMHVRNCKVVDAVGKIEHTLIDEQGCSADLQIIDHPHYDTYHDSASAHMWAFKVPDMASLQIKCDILICSNIKSSVTNTTSCEDIPSPPFCADVVTSPPNSILSDASSYIKHRRASVSPDLSTTQSVRTSICLSESCRINFSEEVRVCINTQLATTSTGLSVAFLLFAISFQIIARTKRY